MASFIVSIPSQVIYAPISNATTTTVPSNTTLPTESVTATSGTVMGVTAGTWNDGGDLAPTTSYQWQISSDLLTWTSVSGAISASYTPVPGQVGSYLRAQVTRTNSLGSTSVINAAPSAGAQNSITAWSNTGTISTSSSNTPSANWQVSPNQLASSCSLANTFLANK